MFFFSITLKNPPRLFPFYHIYLRILHFKAVISNYSVPLSFLLILGNKIWNKLNKTIQYQWLKLSIINWFVISMSISYNFHYLILWLMHNNVLKPIEAKLKSNDLVYCSIMIFIVEKYWCIIIALFYDRYKYF